MVRDLCVGTGPEELCEEITAEAHEKDASLKER